MSGYREDHKTNRRADLQSVIQSIQSLFDSLLEASKTGTALHEVELRIWRTLLSMGHQIEGWYLDQHGTGDLGEGVTLENGKPLRRLKGLHSRRYLSIFGEFEIFRTVYGTREGQKIAFVPLDDRLCLPAGKFSFLLQSWDQMLACDQPYAEVAEVLEKILGLRQHVDSLISLTRQRAADVEAFRESRAAPPPAEEGEIVVATADCKGVPIRRSADAPKIVEHESKSGPKPDRRKMAAVGAAYTVDPFVRTPEEVVEALFRRPGEEQIRSKPRPEPRHKRLWASLTHNPGPEGNEDDARHALASIFGWLGGELETRNPDQKRKTVVIMDGQASLWDAAALFFDGFVVVWILDLLHVTSRVWKAARLFHPGDEGAAQAFVRRYTLQILRGQVTSVIRSWQRLATLRDLGSASRRELNKICGYFAANRKRMKYDQYLGQGYPIASGVIEGACRHYVKDRMERAGMNWIVPGAQAMLDIRSVYLNGEWDDFQEFTIQRELDRIHPYHELVAGNQFTLVA
jgi:hypothetical protein